MNISMNAQASASTSILPLPWSEEALRGPHALRLPFSASTPVITLAPPNIAQGDGIVEEPEEMYLGSPRSPAQRDSPRLEVPTARPLAPSQTNDESLHLALVLAFGNDKYSGAFGSSPSPPVTSSQPHQPQQLVHRSYSTPPSYFSDRPKTPVQGRFARSPGPTPPHSPGPTPRQRDSREQPRKWNAPAPVSAPTPQRPSYEQRGTSSRSSESSELDAPRGVQPRPRSTPPPPLDLRFESDYFSDSPTSANSSGSGLGSAQYKNVARKSTYNLNSQPLRKPEGTLMIPIPLMLRPRPIWRTTPRSALSSPAYAPAAHLVRRSTFIAAGLDLQSPVADLSAFGVETRALMFGRDAGVVLPGFDV